MYQNYPLALKHGIYNMYGANKTSKSNLAEYYFPVSFLVQKNNLLTAKVLDHLSKLHKQLGT